MTAANQLNIPVIATMQYPKGLGAIESFVKDKKRVIPCASLCQGEFGVNGYFIGVPTVIGSNCIEKILDFKLKDNEKAELNKTLVAVKKTDCEELHLGSYKSDGPITMKTWK